MTGRPSNNPYGNDALMVDRLIGTAYDVVRIVSENIIYVKHLSLNMEQIATSNENIEIIRPVSEQIDLVVAVADSLSMLTTVNANSPALLNLNNQLAKLLQLHAELVSIALVANNMPSINLLVQNMNKIDTIIDLLPQLIDVINRSPEILASIQQAKEYADFAASSASLAGTHKNAAQQSATAASTFAASAQTAANGSATSASNAEQARAASVTAKEQSITARNESVTIRDNLLSGISAIATTVANGQPANAAYNPTSKRISFEIPAGPPGSVGPANELSIGVVQGGSTAAASVTGNHPNQKLNLTLPAGANAWQAVIATVIDGDRRVQRIVDWAGGSGPKPAVGAYLGSGGYVSDIAQATNVRGTSGSGTGDMVASTYDPTNKALDAFQMSNMSEGADAKIFREAERLKLAGIPADADKTPVLSTVATSGSYNDLTGKPDIPQGTVTSVGITPPTGMTASEDVTVAGKILLALSAGYNFLTDALLTKLNGIAPGATANATDAALRARSSHTGTQAMDTIDGLATAISDAVAPAEKFVNKGQANGYAGLDANGKIPTIQLPEAILGSMRYQGTWNASTNNPVIPTPSAANKGHYYIVGAAGTTTVFGVSDWQVGDWIVSRGDRWDKIDSSDQVNSVNGKQGNVVITKTDVGLNLVDNTADANKPVSTPQQNALNGKQNALGFTPVQQGTGTGQGGNLLRMGWLPSSQRLGIMVDGSDFGWRWPIDVDGSAGKIRDNNSGQGMTFNWSGQAGSPSWVWGGSDGQNMYVYNPAEFTVKNSAQLGGLPASSYATKAYSDGNSKPSLGIGQTFKRPNPLPVLTTPRQNTSGKPIWIYGHVVFGRNVQALFEVSADGTNWFAVRNGFFNSTDISSSNYEVSIIVPDGYWIRCANGNWGPYYLELS